MAKNIFAALMLALLFCGCGGGSGSASNPVTLTSINVTTSTPTIAPGTTAQFRATGIYSNGSSQDLTASVSWVSAAPAVATIGNLGVATAQSVGGSAITAASGTIISLPATLTVAVPQSITISPAIPAVGIASPTQGTNQQFSATGNFAGGSQNLTNFVIWNSSNQGTASIGATSGLATAVGPGQTQITASFGSVTSSPPVTFTVSSLQSLAVAPTSATLDAGSSLTFTAIGTLSDASTPDLSSRVTWNSDNPAIVAISATGAATFLSPGSTTIRATFLGMPATPVAVTVLGPTLITVTPANQSIVAGSTLPFTATGTFADGTRDLTNLVTWSSSSNSVATISNAPGSRGVATAPANATGTTVISASFGSAPPGSTSLTSNTLATLSVTPTNASVVKGAVLHLSATGTFTGNLPQQDLTNQATWSSNSPGVASVSNLSGTKGLVTALAVGSATVTASIGGQTASTTVTVSNTAVIPPTNRAYVTNFGSNTLSVIDTVGLTLLSPDITVGSGPRGVALNPATSRAYVANSDGTLSVIDITSNTVVASVTLGGGGGSWGVAVIPALNRVYVANSFGATLTVVDTTTNTVVSNVTVGAGPRGVAVNPAANRVYVANSGGNSVSVIDAVSNLVLNTISNVGLSAPQDIAANTASGQIYVANGSNNLLSVINPATSAFIQVSTGTTSHQGVAINQTTSRAYVTNSGNGTVSAVSTVSNTELASSLSPFSVGSAPQGIAVNAAKNRVYVANQGSNNVSVINTASDSNSVVATIPVGSGPMGIAVLP